MFLCVSRCIDDRRLYFAFLTNDLAIQAYNYLNKDRPPNVVIMEDVPTLVFYETEFHSYEDPHWVKSYIRLAKEHHQWEWNTTNSMLPPLYVNTRREQLMLVSTKPAYKCVGFTRFYTPILTLLSRDFSNNRNYRLKTTLMQITGFPAPLITRALFQPYVDSPPPSVSPPNGAAARSVAESPYITVDLPPPAAEDQDITYFTMRPPPSTRYQEDVLPPRSLPNSRLQQLSDSIRTALAEDPLMTSARAKAIAEEYELSDSSPDSSAEEITVDKEEEEGAGEEEKPRDHDKL